MVCCVAGLLVVVLAEPQPDVDSEFEVDESSSSTTDDHEFLESTDIFYRYELGEEYVCGDGSPFTFYARRPSKSSPNYNKWIVRHEGGGRYCEDNETCAEQCDEFDCYYLTSMPERCIFMDPEGGLSCTEEEWNARFYDWSMVWIHACNGDDWLGQLHAFEGTNPTSWHFTGSINMWATFNWLAEHLILPGEAEELIFAGGDTAGHSYQNQVNDIDLWADAHYPGVQKTYIIDGAWNHEEFLCYYYPNGIVDPTCDPYLGNLTLRWANHGPALNPECTEDHTELCYIAAEYSSRYIHPDVLEKTIVINSYYDTRMLASSGNDRTDEWIVERAEYLFEQMLEAELPNVWMTSCGLHAAANKEDWYASPNPSDGLSAMEAVYALTQRETVWSIDDIDGPAADQCAGGKDLNFPGMRTRFFAVCNPDEEYPQWYQDSINE